MFQANVGHLGVGRALHRRVKTKKGSHDDSKPSGTFTIPWSPPLAVTAAAVPRARAALPRPRTGTVPGGSDKSARQCLRITNKFLFKKKKHSVLRATLKLVPHLYLQKVAATWLCTFSYGVRTVPSSARERSALDAWSYRIHLECTPCGDTTCCSETPCCKTIAEKAPVPRLLGRNTRLRAYQ